METVGIICLSDCSILTQPYCCELHSETHCSFRAVSHSPPPSCISFCSVFLGFSHLGPQASGCYVGGVSVTAGLVWKVRKWQLQMMDKH